MKSTFLQVVDLCRPDEWRHSQSKWNQITLGWMTRAVPPLAIGLTLIVGNRTGKLRVRVYPRVGSGMGRNIRHGSGTGTGSIIGHGYGSGSCNGRSAHPWFRTVFVWIRESYRIWASCLIYARALLQYVIFIVWCVLTRRYRPWNSRDTRCSLSLFTVKMLK